MSQNSDLPPVQLPMTLRFDEAPTTEFLNDLDALTIELVDHPTPEQMRDVGAAAGKKIIHTQHLVPSLN